MASVKMNTSRDNQPFDLVMGDGCYYTHKETGHEIRLVSYRKSDDSNPDNARIGFVDKYGKQGETTQGKIFKEYFQEQKSDFKDPVDPRLPYVFDLFFDVKSISDLKRYISDFGMSDSLKEMMIQHNVVLR